MKKLAAVLSLTLLAVSGKSAAAQPYPSRPVTVIIPFTPGGPVDTVARVVTDHMRGTLGQPFVIENVSGAGGSIAVGRVARAAPNGYTLGHGDIGTYVLNGAVYPLNYDLIADFDPVALVASSPLLVLAKKSTPAKDLNELLGWLAANHDKVSQGHLGSGTLAHLCGLYMQKTAAAQWTFVPYRGAAPAMQDVIAGRSLPLAQSGQIKAYAVMGGSRLANAPDIPTADEAGLPDFHLSFWQALWAPKGTPKDIVAKLNAAAVAALADPAVRKRLAELGQGLPTLDQQTPQALGALRAAEAAKWWPIIKAAGIKPD
jgi:tripartite-type tricarboxylate transporter receptor subunit TctC